MITVTARDAAGDPIPRAKVTVTLVAGPRPTDPGFVIDDNHTIVTGSQHVTNQAGNLELDLASTDDGEMDPPGCFYLITAAGAKRTIEVPATGDYDWGDPDIALIDPASPEAAHGIPTGGTDGQVLTKVGTTPYATAWEDATGGGGGPPTGGAGGVLSGTYPNPGFAVDMVEQTELVSGLAGKADLVGGFVPTSQLPTLAVTEVFTVANQAAMLALTAQRGDLAIRTDTGHRFVLSADTPGTLGAWVDLGAATDAVTSVNGQTGIIVLGAADVSAVGTGDSRLTDTRTPTDGSVTTAKIADGAVTAAKLAVPGWQVIHNRTLGATSATETFALTGSMWRIRIMGHVTTTATATVSLRARLNGDTGSNYSSAGNAAATSFAVSNITSSHTNVDRLSVIDLQLAHITGHHTFGYGIPLAMAANASLSPGTAAPQPQVWLSTAAPTSLELYPASSTFEPGTRFIIEAMA